eukprot:UN09300
MTIKGVVSKQRLYIHNMMKVMLLLLVVLYHVVHNMHYLLYVIVQ